MGISAQPFSEHSKWETSGESCVVHDLASGLYYEIPRELFEALREFLVVNRDTGSLTIHFRSGGVAGIEALRKKIFKGPIIS